MSIEFGKEFDAEDGNWKKFWEALVERKDPFYDGDSVIEIYEEISGLDIDEAIDELWQYFDEFSYNGLFNKEITAYDLEKAIVYIKRTSKKFIKDYLVTIEYHEDMCYDNIFEDEFKITIQKIDTRREEFAKDAANKFSSIEDFARWVYNNTLFESISLISKEE